VRGRAAGRVGAAAFVALTRLVHTVVGGVIGVGCAAIDPPYPVHGAPPACAEERRVAQAARRIVIGPPVDTAAWRALVASAADQVAPLDADALAPPYARDRAAVLALARAADGASSSTRADDAADAAVRQLRERYGPALEASAPEGAR
jgi:hypothetical protein